jgi:hypothetical protein
MRPFRARSHRPTDASSAGRTPCLNRSMASRRSRARAASAATSWGARDTPAARLATRKKGRVVRTIYQPQDGRRAIPFGRPFMKVSSTLAGTRRTRPLERNRPDALVQQLFGQAGQEQGGRVLMPVSFIHEHRAGSQLGERELRLNAENFSHCVGCVAKSRLFRKARS